MKVRFSLYTSRLLLLLGLALMARPAYSQTIYEWESWRQGRNVAGLDLSSGPRGGSSDTVAVSNAELSGGVATGGFRGFSEAPTLWSSAVAATTEVHLPDVILLGDFSFRMDTGREMTGSMFTNPGYYPIDILEFTPGPKTRQTYTMNGGFVWKNSSRFTPGVTFHFLGSDYSKRKDLRYTTYRQEFEAVPSVTYDGTSFALGASLILGKESEFVRAEQIGSATSESYYAFLDKGIMYGTYQVWDGSGTHLSEFGVDRFPVKGLYSGFALQAEIGNCLYSEVEYTVTRGEAGEKGYTWFRLPGSALSAKVIGTIRAAGNVHVMRFDAGWVRQDVVESVMEKVTSGGVTVPVIYAENTVFEKRVLSLGPGYALYNPKGFKFATGARVEYHRNRSTLMYPFVDSDDSVCLHWNATADFPVNAFDFSLNLLAGSNVGGHRHVIENEDESLGLVSSPFRMTELWDLDQEFSDAFHIGGGLGVKYNFGLGAGSRNKMYTGLDFGFVRAFGIQFLPGSSRVTAVIKLGYNF